MHSLSLEVACSKVSARRSKRSDCRMLKWSTKSRNCEQALRSRTSTQCVTIHNDSQDLQSIHIHISIHNLIGKQQELKRNAFANGEPV